MSDDDRIGDDLDDRLRETTETLWTRAQTSRAVVEEEAALVPATVTLTDLDIAEAATVSLPVVRAWLDAADGATVAVERDGDTRLVRALLGE